MNRGAVLLIAILLLVTGLCAAGEAHAAPEQAILVFDTSGSMRHLLPAAVRHAETSLSDSGAVITVLAVDESGRELGTYDLTQATGRDRFVRALQTITASSNDTNLDEVIVRIEHVAYRRELPVGTPVYVYSDNISDPTPGHPRVNLTKNAVGIQTLTGGLKRYTLEVGRGFAAGKKEALPSPDVVSEITVAVEDGPAVAISWQPSNLASRYVVCRAVEGGEWADLAIVESLEYRDAAVHEGETLQYVLIAESTDGARSIPSAISRAVVPVPPPTHPVPVLLVLLTLGSAVAIGGLALASRLFPAQEVVEDGAFGRVVPLGMFASTVGDPELGVRMCTRLLPTQGRVARALGAVAVNGRPVEAGTRIMLNDGDQLQTGTRTFCFRGTTR